MVIREKIGHILEILQKYTKTDIKYIAKGNFWLGSGTGLGAIIVFLLVIAFGNFIAPEVYGTYRFFLSYAAIFGMFALSGFSSATVRAVAQGFEGELLRSYKIQTRGALVGSLAAIVFALYYFWNDNAILGWGFSIIGLALPLFEPLLIYNAFLVGKKKFKVLSFYTITSQLFAAALLLLAIFFSDFNAIGFLATYFVGWTVARLFFFVYTIKRYKPNNKLSPETKSLGTHLTLMGVLNKIASYLDRIAIFHFLGAPEVAIYSFAIAPTEQAKGLFKNINSLALPRFSQRNEGELKKTMIRKMILMGLAVAAFVIPFFIFAPFLFEIFLPKYLASVSLARIFALSLFGVLVNLPLAAMKSLSKIKGLYMYNTALSILGISLILVLTPLYGILGTIVARLITRIAGVFLSLIVFFRS